MLRPKGTSFKHQVYQKVARKSQVEVCKRREKSFIKGQMNQKTEIFSFVALPSLNTKKKHPNEDLGKDFSSQAFIER